MFQSDKLTAGRTSAGTAVADTGILMDADGPIVASETASTAWPSLAADATGTKGTAQQFRAIVASPGLDGRQTSWQGSIYLRIPWTLSTQCAHAASGTMAATVELDGTELAASQGAARNLNASNGTKYTEIIELPLSAVQNLKQGSRIVVKIQPKVTTASGTGGDTWLPTLRHDPQSSSDALTVEMFGLGAAP